MSGLSLRTCDAVGRNQSAAKIASSLLRSVGREIFEVKRSPDGSWGMHVWDRAFSEHAPDGFAWYAVSDNETFRSLWCSHDVSARACPRKCRRVISNAVAAELARQITAPAFVKSRPDARQHN